MSQTDFGFSDNSDNDLLQSVTIINSPATGTLTLSGNIVDNNTAIDVSDIDSGQLQFTPAAQSNGFANEVIQFRVQDTGGTDLGGLDTSINVNAITFDVVSVNDAPQAAPTDVSILENNSHVFSRSDFGFSDEHDGDNFTAVLITNTPLNGTLTLNNSPVTTGSSIAITDIDSGNFLFTPAQNDHGLNYANLEFNVQDDGDTDNNGRDVSILPSALSINVLSVNNEPSGADSTVSLSEDNTLTIETSHFGFSDIVEGDNFQAVKILNQAGNGRFDLAGIEVTSGQLISVTDINAGNLQYTPTADSFGAVHDQIIFQVQDDGGTDNGGIDLDQTPNLLSIDVLSVNDEPDGIDTTVTILEDQDYQFGLQDFQFNDIEDDALLSVSISTEPDSGELPVSYTHLTLPTILLV